MRAAAVIALAGLALAGAASPLPRPSRSDRYRLYEPLESPEARGLLERARDLGRKLLGEPAMPVRQGYLR